MSKRGRMNNELLCSRCEIGYAAEYGFGCVECGTPFCLSCSVGDDSALCRGCIQILLPQEQREQQEQQEQRNEQKPSQPVAVKMRCCWYCHADTPRYNDSCKYCNAIVCPECHSNSSYCELHYFRCRICDINQFSRHPCSMQGCRGLVCKDCGQFGNALFFCNEHTRRCFFCYVTFPQKPHNILAVPQGHLLDNIIIKADLMVARFANLYCCDGHVGPVSELVAYFRSKHFDFNVISIIFSYCYKNVYYTK